MNKCKIHPGYVPYDRPFEPCETCTAIYDAAHKGDAIPPPPKKGEVRLPNGCTLYWNETEQGREYISDEIGGGVVVWHTALVDAGSLLAAIVQEATFLKIEQVIAERVQQEANRRHAGDEKDPWPGCVRHGFGYTDEQKLKVSCTCYGCNDFGDFS